METVVANLKSFTSGAAAGLLVDVTLFPIDTLKTRLQSHESFIAAGGFHRLYAGLPSLALGSIPNAAIFFVVYDQVRNLCLRQRKKDDSFSTLTASLVAVTIAEPAACLIRVPTEVIKQRAQVSAHGSTLQVFRQTLLQSRISGLYRGFAVTVWREIPFSFIQFPLWELLKKWFASSSSITPLKSAIAGGLAGGIAAALTTPLDVTKTRIMLNMVFLIIIGPHFVWSHESGRQKSFIRVLANIYKTEGLHRLFAGIVPRVSLLSFGGFIFLGSYETVSSVLDILPSTRSEPLYKD